MFKIAQRIIYGVFLTFLYSGVSAAKDTAVRISGFTEAFQDVSIGLPEPGILSRINVVEGQFVKEGDVLLYLDKTLEELEVARRRLQVSQTQELVLAQRRENILEKQYLSAKRLMEGSGVLSQEEFDTKEMEYEQSKAERTRQEATKKIEKIELKIAMQRLERRILKAPVSGVVVSIAKKKGESVQVGETLIRLIDSRKGYFLGNAEFQSVPQLTNGQYACLKLRDKEDNALFRARIIFVSPVVDTASGLIAVKAEFNNNEPATISMGVSADLFVNIGLNEQSAQTSTLVNDHNQCREL